jgi:hypothetical protein
MVGRHVDPLDKPSHESRGMTVFNCIHFYVISFQNDRDILFTYLNVYEFQKRKVLVEILPDIRIFYLSV